MSDAFQAATTATTAADSTGRCFGDGDALYAHYHDTEWGVPVYDDRLLFEMLILEGAQAGLSWITVLRKRAHYKAVFHNFDPQKVAAMTDSALESLLSDPGIIRNRLKIFAARKNAAVFLDIQREFGRFSTYLWAYVDGKPIKNSPQTWADVPASTPLSDAISRDLKKRGMTFVGTTIIYAYIQGVGLVDDHLVTCPAYQPPTGE